MIPEEELLSGVRWSVLDALGTHGSMTASEIAATTGTSLPGVSQAMKLLEAYGYIEATPIRKGSPGKPRLRYRLKKETALITVCAHGLADRYSINPRPMHVATLRILDLPTDDRDWLLQFLWTHRGILEEVDAIGYVRSDKDGTHLLVITEDVDGYRKEYSNVTLEARGKKRKIVSWSHTRQELKDGLERSERYFEELLEDPVVLYDPKNILHHG